MSKVLKCEDAAHEHDAVNDEEANASAEPHVHTEHCYETVLTCGFDYEHTHTTACYPNLTADVETPADWEASLPTRTGTPANDLVAVTRSQIGYRESENNYIENQGKRSHYSRYGEWYGNPYGEWNAMFASFCLHYAAIAKEDVPQAAGIETWISQLKVSNRLQTQTNRLAAGSLVFIDTDSDGVADRAGITESVSLPSVYVIEGNHDGTVAQVTYDASQICGFVLVSEQEEASDIEDGDESAEVMNHAALSFARPGIMSAMPYDSVYHAEEQFPTSTANEWQIVSQNYAQVASEDKIYTYSDNNAVRLQKAVIPTGTENSFQIYLNVEPQMSWQEFLEDLGNYATHNKASSFNPSSGCTKLLSQEEYDLLSEQKKSEYAAFLVRYTMGSKVYTVLRYGNFYGSSKEQIQAVSNGSYAFESEKFNVSGLLRGVDWPGLIRAAHEGASDLVLDVNANDLLPMFTFAEDVVRPKQVTDPMGEHISYTGMISYDGGSYVVPGADNAQTLTWTLPTIAYSELLDDAMSDHVVTAVLDGKKTMYYTNVLQMRYAVSLNVAEEGFHSAAPLTASPQEAICDTNGETILSYLIGDTAAHRAEFPIPQVRGLLYDISFLKIDADRKRLLEGAVFGLFEADGITPVQRNGTDYTVTTTRDGKGSFVNLPCGQYVLRELSAPRGYSAISDEYPFTLCYTMDRAHLERDASPYLSNMRSTKYDDADGQFSIKNERNAALFQIQVLKTDETGKTHLPNVGFSITDPDNPTQTMVAYTNEQGSLLYPSMFQSNIEYTLEELQAPDGYYGLPAAVRFKLEDDGTPLPVLVNAQELYDMVKLSYEETEDGFVLTIAVKNQTGFSLPETGGAGIIPTVFMGIALMALPLTYGYIRRRKRERRFIR